MSPTRPNRGLPLLGLVLVICCVSPLAAQSGRKKEGATDEKKVERTAAQEEALTARIQKDLETLVAGKARYDGKIMRLTYQSARDIQNDHEWLGGYDSAHANFEIWNPDYDPHPELEGHTEGFLLLKPCFRGDVRVDLRLTYKGLEKGATFLTLAHANESTFVGSNLGAHAIVKSGRKMKTTPARSKELRRDPGRWLDRTATSSQHVIIADGELQVGYNGSGATAKLDRKAPTSGRVGFYWKGVFFRIHQIEIRGELDRDWAAAELGFDPSSVEEPTEGAEAEDGTGTDEGKGTREQATARADADET